MKDKIATHLYDNFVNGRVKPLRLHIGPTTLCNLNCGFCWRQGFPTNENYLPPERFVSLIHEAADLGVEIVHLQGSGEPFFYKPDLVPVMQAIKERGMYGNIVTNGTLFDKEKTSLMVEIGWDEINFSLDSTIADVHDELRGAKNVFAKVIQAITDFNHLKDKHRFDKPLINLHVVITNRNYREIRKIFKLAERLNINSVHFIPLLVTSPMAAELDLSLKQRLWLENEVDRIIDSNIPGFIQNNLVYFGRQARILQFFRVEDFEKPLGNRDLIWNKVFCFEPWYSISIDNSVVDYCDVIENTGLNINNCSLSQAWNSETFSQARQKFISGIGEGKCRNCCMPDSIFDLRQRLIDFKGNKICQYAAGR